MMNRGKREARRSIAILALLVANLFVCAAHARSYNLSKEDVLFLQDIAKHDEFVRRLGESDHGIRGLGGLFAKAAEPTQLEMQWHQALIRGWRRANRKLDARHKATICDSLVQHWEHTRDPKFFHELYKARGCSD
jgi:hypothetical protein